MKVSKSVRIFLVFSASLLPFLALAAPLVEGWNQVATPSPVSGSAQLLAETENFIDVEWIWAQFEAITIATPEGNFQVLSLGDRPPVSRQSLGQPELPLAVEFVKFPSGSIGRVEVLASEWVSFDNVRPSPVQFPSRDGQETPPFAYDSDAYKSNISLPEELGGVTTPKGWGGLEVGSLWVSPFRYIPALGRLEFATRMKVRLWFEPDGGFEALASRSPSPWIVKAQQATLLNPPDERPVIDDADEPEPYRLLVIVRHQEALNIVAPLIDLHQNSGLRAEIWMIDEEVEPEDIKDRIRDMYVEGLQHVLFIGDGDSLSPDVPMYFWDSEYPGSNLGEPDACGSDSWYTCLDNPDRDGYDDHLPDIALGRFVYDNVNALDQLQIQVAKTMDYLAWQFEDRDSEWLRRGLMVAHKQLDRDHDYIPCKQTIVETEYNFPTPEWTFLPGNVLANTNDRLIDEVNGGVGIFNYRGHGDERQWWHWNRQNHDVVSAVVAEFDNRQSPFILFSSACLTADIYAFRGTCLMESFQKHADGGSLAANGCTMTTITLGNSYADIEVFLSLYNEGIFNIGYANNAATTETVLYFDANAPNNWRGIGYLNMRAYLWLGDATISYRLAPPASLAIEVPQIVPEGTRQIGVDVIGNQVPFPDAVVTVRTADNSVFALATTDGQGHAVLHFDEPLEMQQSLIVTATNREAIPTSSNVLVANGLGIIEGTVTIRANDQAVAGATVELTRFMVTTETAGDGSYRLEGIPSGQYELVASVAGMIPASRNVQIIEDVVIRADFELTQSRMRLETESVEVEIPARWESSHRIVYHNNGDARLEWEARFEPDIRAHPYEHLMEFFPGWENEDSRIYGAIFVDNRFYVAGGNSNGDPNYIYVFDRDGSEIQDERFEQVSAGNGFRDLDWDGSFLYGASDTLIKVMNLEGDLIETIPGPYNPSRAIAIDADGSVWVGNNRSAIVKINRNGEVLRSVPVNVYVMGLAWYPDQPDGYNLLVWGRAGLSGVELYGANPATGRMVMLQNLEMIEGESAIEGLYVTGDYDSRDWMLVGMVANGNVQTLKLWQLSPRQDWISLDPTEGSLDPDGEGELTLLMNTFGFRVGTLLTGRALITTNNIDEVIELPIQLGVTPNAVEDDTDGTIPSNFALTEVYPNPFNAFLRVGVALPRSGAMSLAIYDLQGRRVTQEIHQFLEAGSHTLTIDGNGLANGLYIIRAESNGVIFSAKAALIK